MRKIEWVWLWPIGAIAFVVWLTWGEYFTPYARECHARGGEPSIPNGICYVTTTVKIMQR